MQQGYLAAVIVGLTRGTYTITPTGFDWIPEEMPEPLEASQTAAEDPSGPKGKDAQPLSGGADAPAASERIPWWRRVFGS